MKIDTLATIMRWATILFYMVGMAIPVSLVDKLSGKWEILGFLAKSSIFAFIFGLIPSLIGVLFIKYSEIRENYEKYKERKAQAKRIREFLNSLTKNKRIKSKKLKG